MLSRWLSTSVTSWEFLCQTGKMILGFDAKVMMATLMLISKLKSCEGHMRGSVRGPAAAGSRHESQPRALVEAQNLEWQQQGPWGGTR